MVDTTTQTVTVGRVSNSGNPVARQQRAGKTIHVPAGDVGDKLEVRLEDKGGYFVARLVDSTEAARPQQPSVGPDTSDIGSDLLSDGKRSHSYQVRSSPAGGSLRSDSSHGSGATRRRTMSRRKK
jgi:hypothetical protein